MVVVFGVVVCWYWLLFVDVGGCCRVWLKYVGRWLCVVVICVVEWVGVCYVCSSVWAGIVALVVCTVYD